MSNKYNIGDIIYWERDARVEAEIIDIIGKEYLYTFRKHSNVFCIGMTLHYPFDMVETGTLLLRSKIDAAKIYREILNES